MLWSLCDLQFHELLTQLSSWRVLWPRRSCCSKATKKTFDTILLSFKLGNGKVCILQIYEQDRNFQHNLIWAVHILSLVWTQPNNYYFPRSEQFQQITNHFQRVHTTLQAWGLAVHSDTSHHHDYRPVSTLINFLNGNKDKFNCIIICLLVTCLSESRLLCRSISCLCLFLG